MNVSLKLSTLIFPILLSTNSYSIGFDIYNNPGLTSPMLATTFVSKLRNTNMNDMEKLIVGECRQFNDYVALSIRNWDLAKFKHKSLDEAEHYSQQLTVQIPYNQSNLYTFPFGVRTYIEIEKVLKEAVYNRTIPLEQRKLMDDMYQTCIQMNNYKYFMVLSSDRYSAKGTSVFLPKNELIKKKSSNETVFDLSNTVSEKDKVTSINMEKKINFTERDYLVANALIRNDLSAYFDSEMVNWIDYRKAVNDVQEDFANFMKKGGRNMNFALLASLVKAMSIKTEGFKGLEVRDDSMLTSIDFQKNDEMLKEIMKKFNY